jgi:hypothetical protein
MSLVVKEVINNDAKSLINFTNALMISCTLVTDERLGNIDIRSLFLCAGLLV